MLTVRKPKNPLVFDREFSHFEAISEWLTDRALCASITSADPQSSTAITRAPSGRCHARLVRVGQEFREHTQPPRGNSLDSQDRHGPAKARHRRLLDMQRADGEPTRDAIL